MSDPEYYLAEAERKIAAICKESKTWEDAENMAIRLWRGTIAINLIAAIILAFFSVPVAILCAGCIVAPIMAINACEGRMAIRRQRYDDQMDQAIAWRDSIKKEMRGY